MSVLHELSHCHFSLRSKTGKHVALIIDRKFFRRSDSGIYQWNEGRDFAVLDASNPNALPEARIGFVLGL